MSKKNKGFKTYNPAVDPNSVINVVASHYKKGKIRASNKTEKKVVIGSCMHHLPNKKRDGEKIMWTNDGRGHCQCRMCNGTWSTKIPTKDKVKEVIRPLEQINNQVKMLTVALHADKKTMKFFAEVGAMLKLYAKYASNIYSVAMKSDSVKKKKHKKNDGGGASTFASWQ